MAFQKLDISGPYLLKRLLMPIPASMRNEFEARRLQINLNRMFAFSIYVIALQLALNIINILKPSDTQASNIMIYVGLSLGTLLLGIVYAVLLGLAKHGRISNPRLQNFLVYSFLYLYLGIQFVFCALNIISTGGTNTYVTAILIVGMVPISKPWQSISTISVSFVYLVLALYLTRNISTAWDAILITDSWANLMLITVFVIFISIIIFDMFKSNFLQSMTLENTVRQRTLELETQTSAAQAASMAKSDFLARMSHELRTPLNAIMGMTQVARRNKDGTRIGDSLDAISNASTLLLGILNDILDMSKIETGDLSLERERFSLPQALREVTQIISLRCLNNSLQFVNNSGSIPDLEVIGDKLRLKQVLLNLLGNAVKFTPEGGKVEFTVRVGQQTSLDITLHFAIRDYGIGMSERQVTKLFEPFEQTDAKVSTKYGGTGLGLAISKNIVERMGGSITVESALDQGSTFRFPLRFALAPKPTQEEQREVDQFDDYSGKRILIVEDIEVNRMILKGLLEYTGLQMDEAMDGTEAVTAFAASSEGYYDLIFMDIRMPNLDGYEATQAIRALKRQDAAQVPILAMTANAYKEDVERALATGMNDHLAKPVDAEILFKALRKYLS